MMNTQKHSLKKQLLGAVVGGTLAVGLYYTYTLTAPIIEGYILRPEQYPKFLQGEPTTISNTQLKGQRVDRLQNKVQKSITFEAPVEAPATIDTTHPGAPENYKPYQVTPGYKPYLPPAQGSVTYGQDKVIHEEVTTTITEKVTETMKHVETLPNSGMKTWLMVIVALAGAALVRFVAKLSIKQ